MSEKDKQPANDNARAEHDYRFFFSKWPAPQVNEVTGKR